MKHQHRYQQAIDYIEQHLDDDLTVEAVAASMHQSTYHFARVFRVLTGRSVMSYVRQRRIARAVLTLRRDDTTPIIDIALAAGFDSQQGFTNAFKRLFGVTPGSYREHRYALPIQEKINMTETTLRKPRGPELRSREAFQIAGLSETFTVETRARIPQLWMQFAPRIGSIPHQVGFTTYGACVDAPGDTGEFTYVAAVEVSSGDDLGDLEHYQLPQAEYAVFTHEGSLDHIGDTMNYIYGEWLGDGGYELNGTPDFERYDERFNPETGTGEMEIWVPVKPRG